MTDSDCSADGTRRTAILIVNYFSHAHCLSLIDSLPECDLDSVVISVWDNSQSDPEYSALFDGLTSRQGRLEIICTRSGDNLGYGAGNNAAWSALSSGQTAAVDTIVIANPDTRIVTGSVGSARADVLYSEAGISSVHEVDLSCTQEINGLMQLHPWTGKSSPASSKVLRSSGSRWVYPGGHFLFIRRTLWDRLGGFADYFFLYCEELDLTLRAKSQGAQIRSTASIAVSHVGGASTNGEAHGNRSGKSTVVSYNAARSRVLLYRRHDELRAYLPSLIAIRVLAAVASLRHGTTTCRAVIAGVAAGLRSTPVSQDSWEV